MIIFNQPPNTLAAITHDTAAMKADAGMVKIHAQTMLPAKPQRTDEAFMVEPAPMIAPVMVWVVETGMPSADAPNSTIDPAADALNP